MAEPLDTSKVEIRPELMAFAVEMEMRLRENDHKFGSAVMSLGECIDRLLEEADELEEVVWEAELEGWTLTRATRIRHGAADVANFAMFIYDNAGREEL